MQKEKVNIAQGSPETRDRLTKFKSDYNIDHPKDKLKTLSDAIDKLIETYNQCDRVMKAYMDVRDQFSAYKECYQPKIESYENEIEELETENVKLKTRVAELEDVN
ncbi:MAG: hypothetical protein ABFD07_17500 [Methanobacterium sp.]